MNNIKVKKWTNMGGSGKEDTWMACKIVHSWYSANEEREGET